MRTIRARSAVSLIGVVAMLGACGDPPATTIVLPGGVNCPGTVDCSVSAEIAPDQNLRPVMTVTVCVTCDGNNLAGVDGIIGTIQSEIPLPAGVPDTTRFRPTGANGCTTVRYVVPQSVLRGQEVTVTIVDNTGAVVSTKSTTIE